MLHDGRPGGFELSRGGRGAASRDAVGLFDESDREPLRHRDVGGRHEIARLDSAAGPVTEHKGSPLAVGRMQVGPGRPVGRGDLDGRHGFILAGFG